MLDTKGFPVYPGVGALTRANDKTYARATRAAFSFDNGITITFADGTEEVFPSTDVSVGKSTGRITFTAGDAQYRIRELRETDGLWLSKYKMSLPVEALEQLTIKGGTVEETLQAFALDDSAYVVGVVYTSSLGRWSRIDGDWVLITPDDDTFSGMVVMDLDPDQSTQFIDLYDRNFVSVTDAEKFEVSPTVE